MANKNKRLILFIKALFSIGIIGFLVYSIDLNSLVAKIKSIHLSWLCLMVLLPHIGIIISALKWQWLLKALNIRTKLTQLSSLYLIGIFFSNFLPSMTGGDVVRIYYLSRQTTNISGTVAATFAERFIGFSALITFVLLILLNKKIHKIIPMLTPIVTLIFIGYCIFLILVFSKKSLTYLKRFGHIKFANKILKILGDIQSNIIEFKNNLLIIIASYIISITFYIIAIFTVNSAALSIGINIGLPILIVIVPLVILFTLLPISLGGIGLCEGGYVYLLSMCGVSNIDAFSIALLLRARLILTAAFGGILFMLYKSKKEKLPAAPSSLGQIK